MDQQLAAIVARRQQAQACQNSVVGNTPSLADQCKANPQMAGCAALLPQDCTNPQIASTNLTCICLKTPGDARCGYAKIGTPAGGIDGSSGSSKGSGTPSTAAFGTSDLDFGPGAADIPISNFDEGQGQGTNQKLGSFGSAAMSGTGGANVPPEKRARVAGGSGFNTSVHSGYVGGGGASAGLRGGAGSRTAAPPGRWGAGLPSASRGSASIDLKGKVDLTRFLPNRENDPRRRVDGIAGPDGITGPFSDNWKKMNNRYEALRWTLSP
jgi:hypothetical protein